ncbi:MAG TPA: glycosyltransferase [Thermoanaerobaculia bacterium]|nr:glycosyltransferase [Thermoanaerobaculia bacterium]
MRTFVISTMAGGGSARALANLANHFAARGDDVGIVTLHGGADGYALHPSIRRRDLGFRRGATPCPSAESLRAMRAVTARFTRTPELSADAPSIAALGDVFVDERSDVVVGIGDVTAVRVILAARGLGIRAIAWEQCDPVVRGSWHAAQELVYPLADAVVMLLPQHTWAYRGAIAIGNAAMRAPASSGQRVAGRRVVGIGRLAPEKGFSLLIEAFARIAERNPEWRLEIYGEGPERSSLEVMIWQRSLERRAALPGETRDVWGVLARADLFVLPSYTEGFGIALTEAMAAGVAPVVVDCGAAAQTIVRHGVDGLRVPRTAEALAAAMERLMRDDGERARLGARALEIVERYSIEAIAAQWDEVLDGRELAEAG